MVIKNTGFSLYLFLSSQTLFAYFFLPVQDNKISSLERNIRDLEDEVQMLKTTGLLHPDDRQNELKQVEVYKSHSKFMKTKVE